MASEPVRGWVSFWGGSREGVGRETGTGGRESVDHGPGTALLLHHTCILIYIHAYIPHTHTHAHANTHTYTRTRRHIYPPCAGHVHTLTHAGTRRHIHTWTHTYPCACIYTLLSRP